MTGPIPVHIRGHLAKEPTMARFLLVHGGYTGGWLWHETVAVLRRLGHEAHPLTLTGLGDRRHLATPATDLDTHIEDVVQAIDHLDHLDDTGGPLVLVGHSYGVHPTVGAAVRRSGQVARVVCVDAPLPVEGESVLDGVPDPAWREAVARRAADHDGWRLPPPPLSETLLWGSLDGVPEDARKRLEQLAAPQPYATLTKPIRLSADGPRPPVTGILCTRTGQVSIAAVEALVATGEPRFQELAGPDVTFFDLDTGHYPMLSCPAELADLLVRAVAGEGHRIQPGPPRR
ncbi:alpha/beta fold hydrolase [Streptomyces sp. NPDC021093]|uniref:alpha/beta fold hydrolase n=1 Tax=Streptomyces sp. NPDC021093 TaxID=3365112 RepID=UPI00378BA326